MLVLGLTTASCHRSMTHEKGCTAQALDRTFETPAFAMSKVPRPLGGSKRSSTWRFYNLHHRRPLGSPGESLLLISAWVADEHDFNLQRSRLTLEPIKTLSLQDSHIGYSAAWIWPLASFRGTFTLANVTRRAPRALRDEAEAFGLPFGQAW